MRCVTLSNGVSLNAEPERSRSAPWQRLRRTYGVKDCLDFVQTTAKLLELVVLPLHVRSLNYFLQSQQSKNANVIFFTIKILFTYSSFYLFYSFSHFKELLCLQHHAVALICKLKNSTTNYGPCFSKHSSHCIIVYSEPCANVQQSICVVLFTSPHGSKMIEAAV